MTVRLVFKNFRLYIVLLFAVHCFSRSTCSSLHWCTFSLWYVGFRWASKGIFFLQYYKFPGTCVARPLSQNEQMGMCTEISVMLFVSHYSDLRRFGGCSSCFLSLSSAALFLVTAITIFGDGSSSGKSGKARFLVANPPCSTFNAINSSS
jgi:hypothetical protein